MDRGETCVSATHPCPYLRWFLAASSSKRPGSNLLTTGYESISAAGGVTGASGRVGVVGARNQVPGFQGKPSAGRIQRSPPIQPQTRQEKTRKRPNTPRTGLILTVPASR